MLHPHVPEGLKHFSTHLFATFLGLLMALGLESCHQRHLQKESAHRAMEAVQAELRGNRKELEDCIPTIDSSLKDLGAMLRSLEDLRAHKSDGKTIPPFQLNLSLPDLGSAAWEASVAAQAVHFMDFEQVECLSRAYVTQKYVESQEPALLEDLQHLGALVLEKHEDSKEIPDRQLEDIILRLRTTVVRLGTLRQGCNAAMQKYDAALALVSRR